MFASTFKLTNGNLYELRQFNSLEAVNKMVYYANKCLLDNGFELVLH